MVRELGNNCLKFTVVDTGRGITERDKKKLFKEFGKGKDTETSNLTGTGLGLNLCQKILNYLDSKIVIKSQEGAGTTAEFTISFEKWTPIYFQQVEELNISLPDTDDRI